MKFMCLVIVDQALADKMQPQDWAIMTEQSQAYDRALVERGVYVHAEALEGAETARTVRVRGDDAMITDGPFTESKEVIGGFILVDVADKNAAMEIARNIPMARLGAVEVRPVMTFS
ncbi:MAG TPA: YciI family protein [Devosia sp.]|nr:YciI family protein [Devosia sp.]